MAGQPGNERLIAGRYRLLSPLGEGGMGTVWRARDETLQREVAVKEVRAPAGLGASDVERMYARLEREAWAAARVANRNVVTVYDVAVEDGRPWIVMELVRGLSLSDVLEAEGPLPPARAARIGAEVLAALRAAHAVGVLHRDVKPGNVLVANDGRVVLTDFGIATVEGSSALTMTGEVIGSPEFLAPERALGRTPGPESDLWSLGVLLYAAVEGISPFRQNTPLSTLRAVVDEELPPARRAGPLAPVIEGLLRKDPAERMAAEDAENGLRLVVAGGTPRAGTAAAAPYSPTVAALPQPPDGRRDRQGPPTPARPVPPVTPSAVTQPSAAAGGPAGPGRDRRAGAFVLVGVLVLALAVAGLTYGLVNRDDSGTKEPRTSSSAGITTGGTAGRSPDGDGSEEEERGGAEKETSQPPASTEEKRTTAPPARSVKVTVTGTGTHYSGACPPPEAQLPTFTATFTVGRLPAEVRYRWVTRSGEVTDPGWRTLSFPAGGHRTQQTRVAVTTYDTDGTYEDAVSVEVRSPVRVTSEAVAFSVTCEEPSEDEGSSDAGAPAPPGASGQAAFLNTGR